jgi:ketosteroid isomerase-like protein
MIKARITTACAVMACAITGYAQAETRSPADVKAVEAAAHGAYLAAINSNDVATLMADLTDTIVYQSPNEPEIVGKEAVRKWAADYIAAYRFHWDKTSIGFTVSGAWAFERYTYKATNTDKATGAVSTDEGKGVNVFHHDADGRWRVAIDGWSSNLPPPKE